MPNIEKVICGWERCRKCHEVPMVFSEAYRDCEYTRGMYCRQDILIEDTIALLRDQQNVISQLKVVNDALFEAVAEQKQIVRCQDCQHWIGGGIDDKDNFIPPKCTWHNEPKHADWFCADGERKENET